MVEEWMNARVDGGDCCLFMVAPPPRRRRRPQPARPPARSCATRATSATTRRFALDGRTLRRRRRSVGVTQRLSDRRAQRHPRALSSTRSTPQPRSYESTRRPNTVVVLTRRTWRTGHVTHGYAMTFHKAQGMTVALRVRPRRQHPRPSRAHTPDSRAAPHQQRASTSPTHPDERAEERHAPEPANDAVARARDSMARMTGKTMATDQRERLRDSRSPPRPGRNPLWNHSSFAPPRPRSVSQTTRRQAFPHRRRVRPLVTRQGPRSRPRSVTSGARLSLSSRRRSFGVVDKHADTLHLVRCHIRHGETRPQGGRVRRPQLDDGTEELDVLRRPAISFEIHRSCGLEAPACRRQRCSR